MRVLVAAVLLLAAIDGGSGPPPIGEPGDSSENAGPREGASPAPPEDPEPIRRVVRSHGDQLKWCYDVSLLKDPSLTGKVVVRWTIDASGTVSSSTVVSSSTGEPELDRCVAQRVRTWRFPRPKGGGVAVVTYPFVFRQLPPDGG